MIKFLIGGSPCTHWSIAQSKNRETTAEGIGWELFRNYLIAKEKFQPDFFLYENNKSAAEAIKQQISAELRAPLQYINSALVSAQNRQRFYVHNFGDVPQPADRGIMLRDILESGEAVREKAYVLQAAAYGATPEDGFKRRQRNVVAERVEAVAIADRDKAECFRASYDKCGTRNFEENIIRTKGYEGVPVRVGCLPNAKGELRDNQSKRIYSIDGKSVPLQAATTAGGCSDTSSSRTGLYAVPVRIGTIENDAKNAGFDSKQYRVYSPEGKATTLCGEGRGLGAKTGLYACPIEEGGKAKPIYRVENGQIEIKGALYPIRLPDGLYIIRKLTVTEACRLQTLPDDYCRAVSATQAYRGLGNGWTAEVIIHLLSYALAGVPKDEEIVVLSMYDGIGTGRYCFDKLGYTNVRYYATEIDKHAIEIAKSNYPDIVECGDAFAVRKDAWRAGMHEGQLITVDDIFA